ncbi:MAG TPA: NACHT domain-containing NTPase [Candidatus Obscuribacterales bacterium]
MADRTKRTMAATSEGVKLIKEKWPIIGKSAEVIGVHVGVSRGTVQKFVQGTPILTANFKALCEQLGLDWEIVAGLKKSAPLPASVAVALDPDDLDELVQKARSHGSANIEKRCGEMKVLDMRQPIGVGAIYTDVNILEKITGRTRRELDECMQGQSPDNFDRFLLGAVRERRVDGLEAVQDKKQLMILGRPGAGKTTFLKRLATLCNQGDFLQDQVPIFVTLKEFAETVDRPGLLPFITRYFSPSLSTEAVARLLQQGRGLVLLDGLDEVLEQDHDRVLGEIRAFAHQYAASHIVITCRIAAREYVFEQFTDVEMADFNDEQIQDFADKWFKIKEPDSLDEQGNSTVAQLFWEAINEREPIKELAINPLLLTLLCLEFEQSSEFPQSRYELYRRALEVLLRKWDGQRRIKRETVYKRLPLERKETLLGQLAKYTFERGDYFFREDMAKQRISQYIQNLPDAHTDPDALLVDSYAVLKSIEAQHGLLTERAAGIYSFSHLTFHEYFTAKTIVDSADQATALQSLVVHLHEKRWREVFLLVAERMESADQLLILMKQQIDQMLANDETLQEFLIWVDQKSRSVGAPYKVAAIRAFYFALALDRIAFDLALALDRNLDLDRARNIAINLDRNIAIDFAIDRARNIAINLDRNIARIIDIDFARALDQGLQHNLYHTRARALAPELQRKLQELQDQLPKADNTTEEQLKQWWQTQGKVWTEALREVMIEHRNIGHDWQFSDEQQNLLRQYNTANHLLVQCLNTSYVNRETRQQIESELFLPIHRLQAN